MANNADNGGKLFYKKGRVEKWRYPDRVIIVKRDKVKYRKRGGGLGSLLFHLGVLILVILIVGGVCGVSFPAW